MIRHTLPLLALLLLAAPVYAQSDAWLGLKAEIVEGKEAKRLGISGGLKVTRIDKGSPAEQAEIETGDIILNADETAIASIDDLKGVLAKKMAGDELNLAIQRKNGRTEPLIVTLGSKQDKSGKFSKDAKVAELRRKIREKESEKRNLQKQLDKRMGDLKSGKAKVVKPVEPEIKPEVVPEVVTPNKAKLSVTLGARFRNLTQAQAKKSGVSSGIIITSVNDGSAAAEAGFKTGDIVISIEGVQVAGTGDLRNILASKSPGDKLDIKVLRNQKALNLTAVLRAK